MLILHYVPAGSASCRVRFCLTEKNADYEKRIVNIREGEHHSAEYLKLNPNGLVPTLVHNERPIWESAVICEYLDDIIPSPALRPEDPYERSLMRNWVKFIDEQCLPALIVFNWSVRVTPYASQWTDAELQVRLERIPTAQRREAWLRAARDPYSEDERKAAWTTLVNLIERMNNVLTRTPWLTGGGLTIADIAAATFIWRIQAISPSELERETFAPVRDWWKRIQTRPGFSVAFDQNFS